MAPTSIRLSVIEQLALELLLEVGYTGQHSLRQSMVIEAFRPWFSPSRTRAAVKQLLASGLIRQVKKSPLTYAPDHDLALSALTQPEATLAGDIYRLVALMNLSGDFYVERSTIDGLPGSAAEIEAALDSLVAEQLLSRGAARYYLYFSDGAYEAGLAKALDDLPSFVTEDAWLSHLVFGARPLPAPSYRLRPSGLAERLVAVG